MQFVQLIINQNWFRQWLGTEKTLSHYLSQLGVQANGAYMSVLDWLISSPYSENISMRRRTVLFEPTRDTFTPIAESGQFRTLGSGRGEGRVGRILSNPHWGLCLGNEQRLLVLQGPKHNEAETKWPSLVRWHLNAFSYWMKMLELRVRFRWCLFQRIQLMTCQHWFRWWLGAEQATGHYLNQWWCKLLTYVYITRPQWVILHTAECTLTHWPLGDFNKILEN